MRQNREIRQVYAKIEALAKSYADNVPLIRHDVLILNGKNSEYIVTAADFVRDINAYLATRVNSTVRDLQELIDFNERHAELELPPYKINEYNEHFEHLRHMVRDQGIDFVLDTYGVDIIMAPADSLLISYAAYSGYPIATLPLSYLDYNGRPFGLSVIARENQEALLILTIGYLESLKEKRRTNREEFGDIYESLTICLYKRTVAPVDLEEATLQTVHR
ncbi:hypothetical protein AYL99_11906 [Fonsecaea erecta]|uniref:Amidase domain-containing protein n=1 Tax=Fonsecaea erecta TaxID=1367422 RepID=A0A178Z2G3_9EURO|nr:hypothetical protein AYL99_11906 [Fonsecaea erecta]OAP53884.1 hypothetical protein AYL99_11906 [Fonsecaea erecta]